MGKWFPKLYDLAMKPMEATRFKKIRMKLVQNLEGRVLEIGSGTGINFAYYEKAKKVDAVEPNLLMNARASKRIKNASVPIELYEASAENLPFADNTFDTVVATLVFCTIPDPIKALKEIQRVSKENAKLLFFEHIRMEQPLLAKAQDILTPTWSRFCDGCQLNRETLLLIKQSGIAIKDVEGYYARLFLNIEGVNVK